MEYFSLPFTVLWAQRQDNLKSPLAHEQTFLVQLNPFHVWTTGGPQTAAPFAHTHTRVNDRLKYWVVLNVLAFGGREKPSRRQELVSIASR